MILTKISFDESSVVKSQTVEISCLRAPPNNWSDLRVLLFSANCNLVFLTRYVINQFLLWCVLFLQMNTAFHNCVIEFSFFSGTIHKPLLTVSCIYEVGGILRSNVQCNEDVKMCFKRENLVWKDATGQYCRLLLLLVLWIHLLRVFIVNVVC